LPWPSFTLWRFCF